MLFFQGGRGLWRTASHTFSGNEQIVCMGRVSPSVHPLIEDAYRQKANSEKRQRKFWK